MNARDREHEKLLIDEVELLLAEKRTYFSLLRTGAAVFALPLSVFAFLWATLSETSFATTPYFYLPVGGILVIVSLLGAHLMHEGSEKLKTLTKKINHVKQRNVRVDHLVV